MPAKVKRKCSSLLILAVVLLANPNFNIIDIFPDFIAWFMLARIFEKPADCAAYFEEARRSFMRLGYLGLARIPALMLIVFIRGIDKGDTDIFGLASLVFAAVEIILLIPAVSNTFEALFHLGERSEAHSLLENINKGKKDKAFTPDSLKLLTYIFLIGKAVCSFIPDIFLLTRITDSGHIITVSKYYPISLIITVMLTLTVGIIWAKKTKRYIKNIEIEGKFFTELNRIALEDTEEKFARKVQKRKMFFCLTVLGFTTLSSLELVFDNFKGINILPRFIYGLLLVFTVYIFNKNTNSFSISSDTEPSYNTDCITKKASRAPLISALLYTVFATFAFVCSALFLSEYEYLDLTGKEAARTAYLWVEIFGVLEFLALIAFSCIFAKYLLRPFILEHTGVEPSSDRYGRTEKEYHKSLLLRTYLIPIFASVAGLARLINIFLNADVQLIFSDITDVTRPTFGASALPWFNLVVSATAVLYIGYSIYHASVLKEELTLKYNFPS